MFLHIVSFEKKGSSARSPERKQLKFVIFKVYKYMLSNIILQAYERYVHIEFYATMY